MSNYWHKKWQTGDIRFHEDHPHPQLLKHFSQIARGKVMVPLCGKSLDLLWLKNQGHEVIGIELSPIACEAFFAENRLKVEVTSRGGYTVYQGDGVSLWRGDFLTAPTSAWDGVNLIYDRASMIALPPDMRVKYTQKIIQNWKSPDPKTAQMLLVTVEYPGPKLIGPPFSVSESEIRSTYEKAYRVKKLEERVEPELSGRTDKFENTQVTEKVYRICPIES